MIEVITVSSLLNRAWNRDFSIPCVLWKVHKRPLIKGIQHRSDSIQGTGYIVNDYIVFSSWI